MLILATLACPLNCMGAIQAANAPSHNSSVQNHQCSCSSYSCGPNQQESEPIVPDDDCECANCLCRDAVVESDFFSIEHSLSSIVSSGFVPELENMLGLNEESIDRSKSIRDEAISSDEPFRILYQSYLL